MRPDLDYEDKSSYSVLVEAEDSAGRTTLATVEIQLINLNEGPYFVENSRMEVDDGDTTVLSLTDAVSYAENRTGAVESYQAVDPDGGDIVWSLWGADAASFTIDEGTLRFESAPDFEAPNDGMYQVTVRATEESAVGGGPVQIYAIDSDRYRHRRGRAGHGRNAVAPAPGRHAYQSGLG